MRLIFYNFMLHYKSYFLLKALFPIRGDNLQQGAAFHFTKHAAFFEKWRGGRGEEKNFFHVKKPDVGTEVFLLFPALIYPCREQRIVKKPEGANHAFCGVFS